MSSPKPSSGGRAKRSPAIIGLRPEMDCIFASIRCQDCGNEFESNQTTVAGVGIATHVCPKCGHRHQVRPPDFSAALDRYVPERDFRKMVELTEEATRIAESWYRSKSLTGALNYSGVNLGEGAERELVGLIIEGLRELQEQEASKDGK